MKYIVIGLGRFGSKLAIDLTEMGHEVLGVDNHEERLDELKDSVTTVIRMDSTNINAIKSLPVDDMDAVIVAIGEDIGASILSLSILKNLKVRRLIGRAVNQMHGNILKEIGIQEIILPLEDSARHVSLILQFKNTVKLTELNAEHAIAEVDVPAKYFGHCLDSINIAERFNLRLVAVKTPPEPGLLKSFFNRDYKVHYDFDVNECLGNEDKLIIMGRINDIRQFVES